MGTSALTTSALLLYLVFVLLPLPDGGSFTIGLITVNAGYLAALGIAWFARRRRSGAA